MKQLIQSFINRFFVKILYFSGVLKNRWSLAIVDKSFKIVKIINPPKNFFWADPFVFKYKKKNYIFFESYSYLRKKGEIGCGVLKDNDIHDFKVILEKKYHLSYPFIFKNKNDIYLVPETSEKKILQVYKCVSFPFKWKLYSTAFKDQYLVDTTILKLNKKIWLFTNQMKKNINEFNQKLFLYEARNLKLKKLRPHLKNPIIDNFNGGRNAGAIFRLGRKLIRPSQINKKNIYGYGLKLSIIEKLNLNNFKEKQLRVILPKSKNIVGIHHISKINSKKFIIDVCLRYSKNI
jgi:hypothetical protein